MPTTDRGWRRRAFGSRQRATLALASAALALLGADSGGTWTDFAPPGGRFAVELPGPPEREQRARLTPVGYVHETKYWLRTADTLLAVELHDIPAVAAALLSEDALLDRAQGGVVEDMHGALITSRALEIAGSPARDFTYRLPGGHELVERVLAVLVGSRLYLVTGMSARAGAPDPAVARFFGSFRFWSEAGAAAAP